MELDDREFGPPSVNAVRDQAGTLQIEVSTPFVKPPKKAIAIGEVAASQLATGRFLLIELALMAEVPDGQPNPKLATKVLVFQPAYAHVVLVYGTDVVGVASVTWSRRLLKVRCPHGWPEARCPDCVEDRQQARLATGGRAIVLVSARRVDEKLQREADEARQEPELEDERGFHGGGGEGLRRVR